jgi:hypothetical protein
MTQAFNLSQFANKVNTSGQADLTTAVTGTLPVANGGTGATTLTSGDVLIGAGTGAVTSVAAGTTGNVLTSNGTTWTSAAAIGGQLKTEIFTAPGTWTKPASCSIVRVAVSGGGGGGGGSTPTTTRRQGGSGGYAYVSDIPVSAPVAITIGSAGNGALNGTGTPGSTSSFGSVVSCTGGTGGGPAIGADGVATVSSGTTLSLTSSSGNTLTGAGGSSNTGPTGLAYSIPGKFVAGNPGSSRTFPIAGNGGIGGAVAIEYIG